MCPRRGELEEHGGGLGRGPERAGPEQGVEAESGVLAVAAGGRDGGCRHVALSRGRVGAEMSLPALGTGRWDTDRCGALATGPAPSWALPVHGLTQTPVRWLSPVFQLRDAGSAARPLGTAPSSRAGLGVPDRRPCCRAQVRPRAEPAFRHGVGTPRHPDGAGGVPESPLVSGAEGVLLGAWQGSPSPGSQSSPHSAPPLIPPRARRQSPLRRQSLT